LPIYCASLGLEIDGRSEVGAVYDPTRRELYTATRGGGAHLNGQPLGVSDTSTLIDALIVTGFPYDVHKQAGDLVALFGAFLSRARAVRRLGSAAIDLCYVAAGRFEAFWEQHLKPWDVSAGALIVEEAGGRVTGMDGSRFDAAAAHLVASNGRVHEEMLTVIREFRAGRALNRTDA
jgi:myo-inositol-1(or 4)-monophosphatase